MTVDRDYKAGADTATEQDWLDRGAYVALQRHYDEVEDEVGEDDPDVQQGDDYLQDALDHRTVEPPAHLASSTRRRCRIRAGAARTVC